MDLRFDLPNVANTPLPVPSIGIGLTREQGAQSSDRCHDKILQRDSIEALDVPLSW